MKHLGKWRSDKNLFICGIAGETEPSRALASKIVNIEEEAREGIVFLDKHDKWIDLHKFVKWAFDAKGKLTDLQGQQTIKQYIGGLFLLARGNNLWTDINEPAIIALRHFAKHRILSLMNSTHHMEGMIHIDSLCATTGRNEGMQNAIAVV